MQVNSQDLAVRQYAQTNQTTKTNAASGNTSTQTAAGAEAGKDTPDVDRVELTNPDFNKMSDSDRSKLVESLKSDLDSQMSRFTNMMVQTFQKQGISASSLQGDNFWKFMASGNYTVDAKTKAEAQEAISEDGFWGVKQTSQRIFDFAQAVAGDDVETMKKMQAAVEKGCEQAGAAWGGPRPTFCGDTQTAVGKLFDEYYASHGATA